MSKRAPVVLSLAAVILAVLTASPWASGGPRQAAAKPAAVPGYSSHELGPVPFTPTGATVGSLALPKGKFVVTAKVVVSVATGPSDVTCELTGGASDTAQADALRGDAAGRATLPLASSAVLGAAGSVGVRCTASGGTANAEHVGITAVKVTTLKATASG